jgi:cell division protein FtsB
MYNKICFGLFALICILNFKIITSSNGLDVTTNLYDEVKAHQQKLLNLERENNELLTSIKVMKDYPKSIEEKARLDLGLIKADEEFYQIITLIE